MKRKSMYSLIHHLISSNVIVSCRTQDENKRDRKMPKLKAREGRTESWKNACKVNQCC